MIGTTIAHYRVLSLLGRGGMGEVYLAENLRLQKRVALKFLSPALSQDGLALDRLQREARAAAELDHPNIARIHDMQEADGRHFLVMEYVEGETLSERLSELGRLDPTEAERIAGAIAAGLEHAHGHGIVHRDIKSANVMLTPDGGVKILDFGLALRADVTTLTQQGAVLGTLAYMSPEQVRGAPVDTRTDLWSLGVVLYECLSGRRPFDGPSAESTIHNILKTAPHSIARVNPTVPPVLDGIVARLLEKDPTRRYVTARDVLRDLGQSPSSQRTVAWRPRVKGARRWLVPAAVIAIAIVATVAVVRWPVIEGRSGTGTPRLAVVAFADLSSERDSLAAEGLTVLIQVGLADAEGCDMVAPEYLRDVQRRRFGSGLGAIPADQALQVVRDAGATHMVSGEMVARGGLTQAVWRITDVKRGKVVATGKEESASALDLADKVAYAAVARLGEMTRAEDMAVTGSVSERVTADPEAYRHYVAATVAEEYFDNVDARRELLRATELDSTFALAWLGLSQTYSVDTEKKQSLDAAERAWRYRSQLGERDRLLLEAWRLHQDYKVAAGLAVYDRILVRWPDSKEALRARASHLFFFQDFVGARKAAEAALRLYPEDTDLLRVLAYALLFVGDPGESIVTARKGQSLQPTTSLWPGLIEYGHLLMAQPDSAEACLRRAMTLAPEEDWAEDLATVAYVRGDLDRAIQQFPSPGFLADAGRIVEATRSLADPSHRAGTLAYAGLWESVVPLLRGFEPEDKSRGGISILYVRWKEACALARTGQPEAAEANYRDLVRALDADPDLPRGFIRLKLEIAALIALAQGKPDSALTLAEDCVRRMNYPLFPEGVDLLELLARAQAESGDVSAAIGTMEAVLRVCRPRALGHYQLAGYFERAGRREDARREYRKCLDLWKHADADYPYPARAQERLAALGGR